MARESSTTEFSTLHSAFFCVSDEQANIRCENSSLCALNLTTLCDINSLWWICWREKFCTFLHCAHGCWDRKKVKLALPHTKDEKNQNKSFMRGCMSHSWAREAVPLWESASYERIFLSKRVKWWKRELDQESSW